MYSEWEIRREVQRLEITPLPPLTKARALLRVARQVKKSAKVLMCVAEELSGPSKARTVKFISASRKLETYAGQVRSLAGRALRLPLQKMGFGYPPVGDLHREVYVRSEPRRGGTA